MMMFHSILAAHALLVTALHQNCETGLHGFQQHCMADWKFYFFRQLLTKGLTSCWVEFWAPVSALVSANFCSKERIISYFFDLKDVIYTYVNRVTRCCSDDIACIAVQCWIFSCAMLLRASVTTLHRIKIA